MSSRPPAVPVRYEPVFERPEPDEAETTRGLVETMRKIQEKT
nr:catalase [Methylibium sp.]